MEPMTMRELCKFLGVGVNNVDVRNAVASLEAGGRMFDRTRAKNGWSYRFTIDDANDIKERKICQSYGLRPSWERLQNLPATTSSGMYGEGLKKNASKYPPEQMMSVSLRLP